MPRTENLTYQETVHKLLVAHRTLFPESPSLMTEDTVLSFKTDFIEFLREEFGVESVTSESDIRMELKLCTRDRVFEYRGRPELAKKNEFLFVPLDVFFYPYTVDPDSYTLQLYKVDLDILIVLNSEYLGRFFFMAGGTEETQETSFIPNKRYRVEDGPNILRHTVVCRMPDDDMHNVFYLARIEPYICVHCGRHAPRMRKCAGCWAHLRMCVRFCSKECQRADYRLKHRFVCGRNNAQHERRIRDAEFEARSPEDQALTLLALSS